MFYFSIWSFHFLTSKFEKQKERINTFPKKLKLTSDLNYLPAQMLVLDNMSDKNNGRVCAVHIINSENDVIPSSDIHIEYP